MLLVYSIYSASMFIEEMDCFQIRYTLLKCKSLKSTVIKILFFKKGNGRIFPIGYVELIKENIQVTLMSFKMYSNQTYFPQEYVNEHGDCSLAEKEYLIPKILERGAQRQTRLRYQHRTLQTNQP